MIKICRSRSKRRSFILANSLPSKFKVTLNMCQVWCVNYCSAVSELFSIDKHNRVLFVSLRVRSLTALQIRDLTLRRAGPAQRGAVLRTRRPVHPTRSHRTQSNLRSAEPSAPWRHLHASHAVRNGVAGSEHSRSDVVIVCDGVKAETR